MTNKVLISVTKHPHHQNGIIRQSSVCKRLLSIDEVETQPRIVNISTGTINVKQLMHWTDSELKEKAGFSFNARYDP